MAQKHVLVENFRISLAAIRGSILRTILTVTIIAFGIMALVGISTAIDALEKSLGDNLMMMGSNTFTIKNRSMNVQMGHNRQRAKYYEPIKFRDAMDFKEQFNFPATVSVFSQASWNATIKFESEKTNPNCQIIGTDENYMATSGNEIAQGRTFSEHEVFYGSHVAIIGSEIAGYLFKTQEESKDRRELMLIITPKIIGPETNLEQFGNEFSNRFKSVGHYINKELSRYY